MTGFVCDIYAELEPIPQSFHTNCTLKLTLSRNFLFSELWYLRELLNFARKLADVRNDILKINKLSPLSAFVEIISSGLYVKYNNRGPQLSSSQKTFLFPKIAIDTIN